MRFAVRGTMTERHPRRVAGSRAFSLVELLIVLCIMLIVVWMGWKGHLVERAKQRRAQCARNLGGQYVALLTYANEHEGRFPQATNAVTSDEPLSLLIPTYTAQTEFWICPASGDRKLPQARPFAGRRISYAYYMGWQRDSPPDSILVTDEQIDTLAKIQHQLAFSSDGLAPANNHGPDGGNYLRVDGGQGWSPSHAAVNFPRPDHITLLNPKH